MAQTHGHVANYPAQKRQELFLWMMGIAMILHATIGFLLGVSVGQRWFPNLTGWAQLALIYGAIAAMGVVWFFFHNWFKRNEPAFFRYREGAEGEAAVAEALKKLPHNYHIFHCIQTPNGDIDHLVIGPTGVFALDAKKWQGHITAERGRLSLNGRRVDRDHAADLHARMMFVKRLLTEPDGPDAYFQGALVFVDSNINIPGGTLGRIDAKTPDQLFAYITTPRRSKLAPEQVNELAARAAGHVKG